MRENDRKTRVIPNGTHAGPLGALRDEPPSGTAATGVFLKKFFVVTERRKCEQYSLA